MNQDRTQFDFEKTLGCFWNKKFYLDRILKIKPFSGHFKIVPGCKKSHFNNLQISLLIKNKL